MSIITDNESLAEFCRRLSGSDYVAIDTEFMREKTYWPKLCLVQLASDEEAHAIDAMVDGIDLQPLLDLMANERVIKVFHAARQDLEIFFKLAKKLPFPLFDTQIAAMVCGFGNSVGYDSLVKEIIGEPVDKSSQFTDWSARPLTQKQINYALGDVTHLRTIYKTLKAKISETKRNEWLNEELDKLTDQNIYLAPPREAWRRIKTRNTKPRFLAILREVAAWREVEAQNRDLPRNRILRDEMLIEIAHHAPSSVSELNRTRNINKGFSKHFEGNNILNAVKVGKSIPQDQCPVLPRRPKLHRGIGPVTDLLKVLLKMKCEQNGVAQKLIASSKDIEKIATHGEKAEVPALTGWRYELFGKDAINLVDGKLALVIHGQDLEAVEFGEK